MAGYSKRSLAVKLGIKAGVTAVVLNEPGSYAALLGKLPAGARVTSALKESSEFIHFFAREKAVLEAMFPLLKKSLAPHGMVWISWPKGGSGVATDLGEHFVRETGLKNGLVDVKVCAVDETWSGLKFVYRVKDRKQE